LLGECSKIVEFCFIPDFWINENNGDLFTKRSFNYEASDTDFIIEIQVTDEQDHKNNTYISIKINNINDNEPSFDPKTYTREIKEDAENGTFVLKVISQS